MTEKKKLHIVNPKKFEVIKARTRAKSAGNEGIILPSRLVANESRRQPVTLPIVAAKASAAPQDAAGKRRANKDRLPEPALTDGQRAIIVRCLSKRYTILNALNTSSMGTVFRAKDRLLEMEVAIKVLPPSLSRDIAAAESIKNEARLAMMLSHENIVRLFHFAIEKGAMYLVMEFVDGRDLRKILNENGALPPDMVLKIAGVLASAVDYAHRCGVLHRDLKPENIMLTNEGVLKIIDFGTARRPRWRVMKSDKTYVEGTPVYGAPEQFADAKPEPSVDIYSMSAVIQELLTGTPIFPQDITIAEQAVATPLALPASYPKELNAVFRCGLAKEPHARWASADTFYRHLCSAVKLLGPEQTRTLKGGGVVISERRPCSNDSGIFVS